MSELLRIDHIRKSACKAADAGHGPSANPYRESDDPRRHAMWRTYYFQQVEANLSSSLACIKTNSHESHFQEQSCY